MNDNNIQQTVYQLSCDPEMETLGLYRPDNNYYAGLNNGKAGKKKKARGSFGKSKFGKK